LFPDQPDHGQGGNRSVPDAYKPMLKDIVDAIERRHSGTLTWFRAHCYHTKDTNILSINEFVKAIESLNILAMGHWKFTSADLFGVLKTPSRDDLDIHELDVVLKSVQLADVRS
jgi:hypothetical protein